MEEDKVMPRILISYRREDSPYVADIISEKQRQSFGADRVFFDINTIPPGTD